MAELVTFDVDEFGEGNVSKCCHVICDTSSKIRYQDGQGHWAQGKAA